VQPLLLDFTSHSIAIRTFLIFSIFYFLNLNILHKKIEDLKKKAFKSYILTDFSFFYKKDFKKLKSRYF